MQALVSAMGFFDRKSRQLRRKLKDLRAELKDAETEGRFVRAQGIFFAELEDMGDMTIHVFGTADAHDSQEESVIRTFFDRNGFTVEELKFAKGKTAFADVEIIPPNEVLRHTATLLQDKGYRIVDDEEREVRASAAEKILSVNSLARAVSLLFVAKVQRIIASTTIKNNKEGNRLLKWIPAIAEMLQRKVDPITVEAVRLPFEDCYGYYYTGGPDHRKSKDSAVAGAPPEVGTPPPSGHGSAPPRPEVDSKPIQTVRFGKNEDKPAPEHRARESGNGSPGDENEIVREVIREAETAFDEALGNFSERVSRRLEDRLLRLRTASPASSGAVAQGVDAAKLNKLASSEQLAKVLGAMYHSLVRAKPAKCVSNSESLLKFVNRLFSATATCILAKTPGGGDMTILAQAGKKLVWGEGGGKGFAISASIVRNCLQQRAAVTTTPMGDDPSASMILHKIETAAASPILAGDQVLGVLYIDRRDGQPTFTGEDLERLRKVTQVFQEFPDLTLGVPVD